MLKVHVLLLWFGLRTRIVSIKHLVVVLETPLHKCQAESFRRTVAHGGDCYYHLVARTAHVFCSMWPMFCKPCGLWFTKAFTVYGCMTCTCATAALRKKNAVFIWWGTQTRSSFVGVDNFVFTVIHVSGAACFIVSLNALEKRVLCWYRCLRDVSLCYAHLKRVVLDLQAPKRCPRLFF